jgi:hypothetical protein
VRAKGLRRVGAVQAVLEGSTEPNQSERSSQALVVCFEGSFATLRFGTSRPFPRGWIFRRKGPASFRNTRFHDDVARQARLLPEQTASKLHSFRHGGYSSFDRAAELESRAADPRILVAITLARDRRKGAPPIKPTPDRSRGGHRMAKLLGILFELRIDRRGLLRRNRRRRWLTLGHCKFSTGREVESRA